MSLKHALAFGAILIFGAAMALPEPHEGMIDNEFIRDVGVVFSKPNFQGDKKFIFEIKDESACQVFGAGDLPSIKICKSDVQCNFYTGSNCELSQSNYVIAIGCGDVAQVSTPVGNYFKHYKCGQVGQLGPVNQTIKTIPHDPTADEAEAMGN
ncbi:hypothetical protein FB567DRAFT_590638 [Paraphoma chrysanthemicola]|uniref:Uncharacterized protein n=1 Tax=Paraphoma chrysanthemicola TaxID=798071 RepID=A0A8K0R843_9PLEO|nr:hypothetical protein FB567DRAFT_590638 [Paraphoma chrysanthemicola]